MILTMGSSCLATALKLHEQGNTIIITGRSVEKLQTTIDLIGEVQWLRDTCLSYFQNVGSSKYPKIVKLLDKSFHYYKSLSFSFSPSISLRW